ncbi:MAG: ABC transporter ATP-binding protein [Solirubrobacterales bacterium]
MRPDTSRGGVDLIGVEKRFQDVQAVAHLDLEVKPGEFMSILGPSGSGKTTTMRIIGGFEHPDAGSVLIGGRDVTWVRPNQRDVNTVFQSYALFPHMTVQRNVEYGLKVARVDKAERRRRAAEALELVQLSHASGSRPQELSGGMRQRVALARALVNRPGVLLLDEPLGALDRKLREEMQIELRQIQQDLGTTFIYVTHDQDEALAMSDRLVVMRAGAIEQLGSPAEVYDNPATLWVAGFVGTSNALPGTVRAIGRLAEVETAAGLVRAAQVHGDVAVGDAVTVVVRPEHVALGAAGQSDDAASGARVQARIQEVLNVATSLRCVAMTESGQRLLALVQRSALEEPARPGDEVALSWSAEISHVYGEGGSASEEE